MRKTISLFVVLILAAVVPGARGADDTDDEKRVISPVHTNINVPEGLTGTKSYNLGITIDPKPTGSTKYGVDYEVRPETATRGQDFDSLVGKGKVVFDSAHATVSVPVAIKGDIADETNETVRLELFNNRCLTPGECDLQAGTPDQGFLTIIDDDGKATADPELKIKNGDANAMKDADCLLDVVLEYGSAKQITLDYETEDLEARGGDDYEETSGTMVLSPGQIRKPVKIHLNEDRKAFGSERFIVNISEAKGAEITKDHAYCTLRGNGPRAQRRAETRKRHEKEREEASPKPSPKP